MLKEATSAFHASDGAAYEHWLGRWSSRLADAFLDFVKFPGDGELLDVGCGTGSLATAMAKRWPGRQVIGVDQSPQYISYAQSRRTGDQPTFETGDACALAYQNGRFAGVAAQLLFLFIPPSPSIRMPASRATACLPTRSPFPADLRASSVKPALRTSRQSPSPSGWTMRASMITGSHSRAGKDRSASIFRT